MKKVLSTLVSSILIGILLYLDSHIASEGSLYILLLIYLVFPIIFFFQGMFLSKSSNMLRLSLAISSMTVIILISSWYKMSSMIPAVLIYLFLAEITAYLKNKRG